MVSQVLLYLLPASANPAAAAHTSRAIHAAAAALTLMTETNQPGSSLETISVNNYLSLCHGRWHFDGHVRLRRKSGDVSWSESNKKQS